MTKSGLRSSKCWTDYLETTVFAFSSDHGEPCSECQLFPWGHSTPQSTIAVGQRILIRSIKWLCDPPHFIHKMGDLDHETTQWSRYIPGEHGGMAPTDKPRTCRPNKGIMLDLSAKCKVPPRAESHAVVFPDEQHGGRQNI